MKKKKSLALLQLKAIHIRPLFVSHNMCVNNKLYVKNKNKCLLFSELNRWCLKKTKLYVNDEHGQSLVSQIFA